MRTEPITKESFEPVHQDHYFQDRQSFQFFIEGLDPLKTFKPVKREINWEPQKRIDPNTGKEFLASHPAQVYADEKEPPKKKRGRPKKKRTPVDYFEPRERKDPETGETFIATHPAQKYAPKKR